MDCKKYELEGNTDNNSESYCAEEGPLKNFKYLFKPERRKYRNLNDETRETGKSEKPQLSILTNKTPIPRRICRAVIGRLEEEVLHELCPDFLKILPLLQEKKLIDSESQSSLEKRRSKVKFILKKILESPIDDALTPFVQCLWEYKDQNGDNMDKFKKIVVEIDILWKEEMKKSAENTISKKLQRLCLQYPCIVIPIIMIVILTIMLLILLPIFSSVPPYFQKQGPQIVTNVKRTTVVMTLDHLINKQFVSRLTIRWQRSDSLCTGNVTVIPEIHCLEPQFLLHVNHFKDSNAFFALPNSSISVTIPDGAEAENLVIRLTTSMKEFRDIVHKDEDLLKREPCTMNCYQTNDYLNKTITLNISESDFYYVFFVNTNDGCIVPPEAFNIDIDFDIISINQTAITDYINKHFIKPVYVDNNNSTFSIISVSEWFDFSKPTCNLFSFYCVAGIYPSFVIENAKPRTDIIFILILSFLFSFILPCVCLFMGCRNVKKND